MKAKSDGPALGPDLSEQIGKLLRTDKEFCDSLLADLSLGNLNGVVRWANAIVTTRTALQDAIAGHDQRIPFQGGPGTHAVSEQIIDLTRLVNHVMDSMVGRVARGEVATVHKLKEALDKLHQADDMM